MFGSSDGISISFAMPSQALAPYVTTYYCTIVDTHTYNAEIEDYLHPEWGNLRFVDAGMSKHAIGGGELTPTPQFVATGPTSVTTRFTMRSGRSWGIGLLPLGWRRFVDADASVYADRAIDASSDRSFAAFHALSQELAGSEGDFESELRIIEQHMNGLLDRPAKDEAAITRLNSALIDSELAKVTELSDRLGMNVRSLERLAKRAFGFPPKLLLRRQRFLRSLAQFMLDPSLKWLNAMDYNYHDQAHFVRDFRSFMGMSPSAYAKLDHPFLRAAAKARVEIAGEAVQGLHPPAQSSEPIRRRAS